MHLDQRPLYELPALTLHEAVPGHHLQIALAQELDALPYFRRNAVTTAYVEGWALYAELLGEELGLYRDPYELFGRLSFEMWRACRLVADVAIHWHGASLEEARRCFTENTALAPHNIQTELERYVSWPAQALAYKVGELRIVALRRAAEAKLGARFDVRDFHDAVLPGGALPLDVLAAQDRRVRRREALARCACAAGGVCWQRRALSAAARSPWPEVRTPHRSAQRARPRLPQRGAGAARRGQGLDLRRRLRAGRRGLGGPAAAQGRLLFLEPHLDRLYWGAAQIALSIGLTVRR